MKAKATIIMITFLLLFWLILVCLGLFGADKTNEAIFTPTSTPTEEMEIRFYAENSAPDKSLTLPNGWQEELPPLGSVWKVVGTDAYRRLEEVQP